MVIDANTLIRNALAKGSKMELLMEQWDFLQSQCACFINSDLPGLPSQLHQAPGKPVKSVLPPLDAHDNVISTFPCTNPASIYLIASERRV